MTAGTPKQLIPETVHWRSLLLWCRRKELPQASGMSCQ
jgi:hypothetical protein